jgi:methylenetetrahydrofolate dehydrogenase (NADP+) / methenyltetrahydrofolate cyclohydrolase
MQASLLSGKKLAQTKQQILKNIIAEQDNTLPPHLTVIVIGNDVASHIYVNKKQQTARNVGIKSSLISLASETSESELLEKINTLNNDNTVHGILVQLPLPNHISTHAILLAIKPEKDVDGFHPFNLGCLAQKSPTLRPCTPYGIIQLLEDYHINLTGLHAVIIGTSPIVGLPMALELLMAKATITACHQQTTDLAKHTKQADLLISAVGKPHFINQEHIKPGAIIVDVGITRLDNGKIVGDINFDAVKDIAQAITPVPGGVGPMTVTALLQNTLQAYQQQTAPDSSE